jgi:hypothetical protein
MTKLAGWLFRICAIEIVLLFFATVAGSKFNGSNGLHSGRLRLSRARQKATADGRKREPTSAISRKLPPEDSLDFHHMHPPDRRMRSIAFSSDRKAVT